MTAAMATPAWFPQLLDPINDRVLLVARTEQDYRDAAFLDERSLRQDAQRQVVEWADLAAAMPPEARRDVQYIFHISHVGSTLISRLLGELPQVLALREPQAVAPQALALELRGHLLHPAGEFLLAIQAARPDGVEGPLPTQSVCQRLIAHHDPARGMHHEPGG